MKVLYCGYTIKGREGADMSIIKTHLVRSCEEKGKKSIKLKKVPFTTMFRASVLINI